MKQTPVTLQDINFGNYKERVGWLGLGGLVPVSEKRWQEITRERHEEKCRRRESHIYNGKEYRFE